METKDTIVFLLLLLFEDKIRYIHELNKWKKNNHGQTKGNLILDQPSYQAANDFYVYLQGLLLLY